MTMYRDLLIERFGAASDEAFVVGCGLDRLDRRVSELEIAAALAFLETNRASLMEMPIGTRRDLVAQHVDGRAR